MSVPRNHHYVSQCQIKNFFNHKEGKIYLYDKKLNNFFSKTTTKTVFSQKDSNSKFDNENGTVDHGYLETDLKNFEDHFTASFNQIENAAKNPQTFTENIHEALIYLTKYGLAGEIRPPQHKRVTDQIISKSLFEDIMPNAAPELKKQLEALKEVLAQTKYSNSIAYSDFANEVLRLMGELFFHIFYIKEDGLFILPDRPSFTERAKINQYFNPDIREIAIVGVPLSSKIFLHVESKKLRAGQNQVITLTNKHKDFINQVNLNMFQLADKQVACESETYLQELIQKIPEKRE